VILFMGFSAISLISLVSQGPPILIYLIHLVFIITWSFVMQFLCLKGLAAVSWLLMFVGFALSIMIIFYAIYFIVKAAEIVK